MGHGRRGDGHRRRVLRLLLLLLRGHVVIALVIGKVLSRHVLLLLGWRSAVASLEHGTLVVLTIIALLGHDRRPVGGQSFQVFFLGSFRLLFIHLLQFERKEKNNVRPLPHLITFQLEHVRSSIPHPGRPTWKRQSSRLHQTKRSGSGL